MIVVLDSSPSVQYYGPKNWDLQINFTRAIMKELKLGEKASRMGIVRFDDESAIELALENGISNTSVEFILKGLLAKKNTYQADYSDMGSAMRTVKGEFSKRKNSNNKVLLFISDGDYNHVKGNLFGEALNLRASGKVKIISIAISQVKEGGKEVLNRISTGGANTYDLENNGTVNNDTIMKVISELSRACLQRDFVAPGIVLYVFLNIIHILALLFFSMS